MMNNKASAAYVAADVNHQAYEEERDAHLKTKAELAAALVVVARNHEAMRMLSDVLPTAGFPVKGKLKRMLRVGRGDRR